MKFEKSLTVSSRGRVEVRTLVERGVYTIVEYRDPKSLKLVERKFKIYLMNENGDLKGYLLIPLRGENKYLAIEDLNPKKEMFVYNMDKEYEEPMFK